MHLLVYGPGRLGGAIVAAATGAGWTCDVIGRPPAGGRRGPAPLADVVVEASLGSAVAENVEHALAAGNRSFVLAATGWDAGLPVVRALLLEHGAAAVLSTNLSLGAALFLRLAETAAGWYARAGAFEPSIVEWHRRGKADRPSGTARAIARRIVAADPRWAGPDTSGPDVARDDAPRDEGARDEAGPADARPVLEMAGIRAGAAPGTHLVTFDGPGESVELRLTARDRTAYADGALAAVRWLAVEPRSPGLHPFDAVVDDLLAAAPIAVPA